MEFKPLRLTETAADGGKQSESEIKENYPLKPNGEFENGRRLSENYRKLCTNDKTGIPLEEIDPFYKQGTFIVIGPKTHVIYRFNSTPTTWFNIKVTNPFRGLAVTILTHWLFTALLVKIILWSCFGSAFNFERSFFSLTVASLIILGIELKLKLIARGFYRGTFSYIRMCWNWLDLFIIFIGIISLFADKEHRAFNWFTILMTLKLIQLTPGMLSAATALKNNLKKMIDFVIFSMFPVLIFALVGLQIYMGILTSKCIQDMSESTQEITEDQIADFERNSTNWLFVDDGYKLCGNSTISCPQNYTCKIGNGENPNYGYTNFDTYFWSVLSVVRLIFQDYEILLYQQILTTAGFWHLLFFALTFFFGTFTLGSFAYAIIGKDLLDSFPGNNEPTAPQISEEGAVAVESPKPNIRVQEQVDNIGRVRQICQNILENRVYEFFVTIMIILDILFLFSHHYGVADIHFSLSLVITGVAVLVYIFEFVLKLIAESPAKYFCKFLNVFDFIVIVLALVYFSLYGIEFLSEEELTGNVSFYSIRALKLAPRWPSLGFLFRMMIQTIKSFSGLFGLLLVYLYILSLLGYILFSTIYTGTLDPRWNFHIFWKSLASVLRILSGECIEFLWDFFHFNGGLYTSIIFCGLGVLGGNFIVMTLAVATALTTKNTLDQISSAGAGVSGQDTQATPKQQTAFQLLIMPCTWFSTKFSGYCKLQNTTMYKVGEAPVGDVEENLATVAPAGQGLPVPSSSRSIRGKIKNFTDQKVIKGKSIVVIILGSLALAFTNVVGVYYVDIIFTVYFIFEIILRVIGGGLKGSLKNIGLIFDIVIILEMILNFVLFHNFTITLACDTGSCGLFYLRNFRPLMLISRIDRLKVIARGIFYELLGLNSYLWASLYLWLVFSIIGVHNFGGKFYRCVDNDDVVVGYVRNKEECLSNKLEWTLPDNNFNDIGRGLLALAHVGSLDNWIPILHNAMDVTDVDSQPIPDDNPFAMLYFFVFYIVGVFFILNILFGVILHNFPKGKVHEVFRTKRQIKFYEKSIKAEGKTTEIPKPENRCLQWCYDFVTSSLFQIAILILILIDLLAYASEEYNQSEVREAILTYTHVIILVLYTIEMILKIIGCRKYYFKSWLNVGDFIMVITSILGLILFDLLAKYFISPTLFRLLRSIRFLRLLEPFALKKTNFLRRTRIFNLFRAMKLTAPIFINFLLFFLVFVYSYLILGFEMFKNVVGFGDQFENFNTLPNAFATLFEMATFGGWASVLQTLRGVEYENNTEGEGDTIWCPPFTMSVIFMFSFLALTFIVVATVYLVFILEIINQFNLTEEADRVEGEGTGDGAEGDDSVRRTKELNETDIEIGEIGGKRELESNRNENEEIETVMPAPE